MKTDLSPVPLELMDVDDEDVTPMEKGFGSKPSTVEDPVMERDLTRNIVAITTHLSTVPLELMDVECLQSTNQKNRKKKGQRWMQQKDHGNKLENKVGANNTLVSYIKKSHRRGRASRL